MVGGEYGMTKRTAGKICGWLLATIACLIIGYITIGGWVVYRGIDTVTTVGAMAAQAPPPTSPPTSAYDLAYVGDPGVALGLAFSAVAVPTDLGPAPAWLVPSPHAPADMAAIYVHGIAGRRENGYRALHALHAAGLPTLLITYRNDEGAPRSPDGRYHLGLTEWRDLDAAVSFMRARGIRRILLVGESMGGGIVGQFLIHSDQIDAIAGIILEAPALDAPAVVNRIARTIGFPVTKPLAPVALGLLSMRGGPDLAPARSIDAVARFPRPLMLIHGTGDRIVPVGISDALLRARFGATTYLQTHADHLLSWQEEPARYDAELRAFAGRLAAGPPSLTAASR